MGIISMALDNEALNLAAEQFIRFVPQDVLPLTIRRIRADLSTAHWLQVTLDLDDRQTHRSSSVTLVVDEKGLRLLILTGLIQYGSRLPFMVSDVTPTITAQQYVSLQVQVSPQSAAALRLPVVLPNSGQVAIGLDTVLLTTVIQLGHKQAEEKIREKIPGVVELQSLELHSLTIEGNQIVANFHVEGKIGPVHVDQVVRIILQPKCENHEVDLGLHHLKIGNIPLPFMGFVNTRINKSLNDILKGFTIVGITLVPDGARVESGRLIISTFLKKTS